MKRQFLEDLGLEKDIIDKVMGENGKDINNAKTKAEEDVETIKTQLKDAQDSLKGFEGVKPDELQKKIKDLNEQLENKDKQYQKDIATRDFNKKLDDAISALGARDTRTVKALLDISALSESKNQDTDIKSALETCQKDNDYLFGKSEPINNPVTPTHSETGGGSDTPKAIPKYF